MKKKQPTKAELAVMDKLSRAMEPEAWVELDAGNGTCSNQAGWKCVSSIEAAKRLIRAFPQIVSVIGESS
jgi:hypothetical protein